MGEDRCSIPGPRGCWMVVSVSEGRPRDLLGTGTSSVTPRPSCCLLVRPYVTAPPPCRICLLPQHSALGLFIWVLDATRPDPAAVCVSAETRGPPRATQPGWEIRIPYCCMSDMFSHHMLGSCWGQLKSGTSCLRYVLWRVQSEL